MTLKHVPDPLSTKARLNGVLKRPVSRVRAHLRTWVRGNTGAGAARSRPFFNYSRELVGEPAKRALLSYLVEPFHHTADYSAKQDYSNWMMSLEIGNALNRAGFAVDVSNYDDYDFIPARDYDVFVGMTANFSRLLPLMAKKTRKIYWATRPDPAFELEAIRQRQVALYQRRKEWFPIPDSILPLLESADYPLADGLILVGNQFTRSTFRTPSAHVYCIDNPALEFSSDGGPTKDFSLARRHFLFLSSWLLLRKGLDVVLEAFAVRPHLNLWICGPVDTEPPFLKTYRKELFYTPNIHTLGWVGMQSEAFVQICNRCAYLVFPSCAEGMSGSVINGMAKGLIPICTPETGVDLEDFGIPVGTSSPEGLGEVLDSATALPLDELQRRAAAVQSAAMNRYTIANFRSNILSALEKCIQLS